MPRWSSAPGDGRRTRAWGVPGLSVGCARCAWVSLGRSSRPLSGLFCCCSVWFWFVVVLSSLLSSLSSSVSAWFGFLVLVWFVVVVVGCVVLFCPLRGCRRVCCALLPSLFLSFFLCCPSFSFACPPLPRPRLPLFLFPLPRLLFLTNEPFARTFMYA